MIPVFNDGALIAETLQSIIRQTLSPEIIVVDDGSKDDPAQVICAFPTVHYHRALNGGVGRARNAGVALAQGDWIAFCDMDDLWRPTNLETVAPGFTHGFANKLSARRLRRPLNQARAANLNLDAKTFVG